MAKTGGKVKGTALAQFAFNPDFSAHALDQEAGNGQPQTRPAIFAGCRRIGLGERLEETILFLGRDPDAVILDGEMQFHQLRRDFAILDFDEDTPAG